VILATQVPAKNSGEYLDDGDSFDFDLHIPGQACNLNSRSGRIGSLEEFSVDGIHLAVVVQILEEYRAFYRFVQRTSCSFENSLEITQNETRLLFDAAGTQLACGGINCNLARGKNKTARRYCLGIRANSLWCIC
jgi:hypothetical protein